MRGTLLSDSEAFLANGLERKKFNQVVGNGFFLLIHRDHMVAVVE